jgi:hypothetical protein
MWKPEETEILRKAWLAGASVPEIRQLLGGRYTKSAVIGKARRLKLPPHANAPTNIKGGRPRNDGKASASAVVIDPRRADKRLRRFSWQEDAA